MINTNNRQRLYSRWFTATLPLLAKSARWIADGQIWLSTYCSASNIQTHFAFIPFLSSLPSPLSLRRKHGCFYKALPLFTWFFVLACHIISPSGDVASLQAHNEDAAKAHRLVSLHWGYQRMLSACHCSSVKLFGSRQIYSRLSDDGLYLFKKKVYHCFLCRRTMSPDL